MIHNVILTTKPFQQYNQFIQEHDAHNSLYLCLWTPQITHRLPATNSLSNNTTSLPSCLLGIHNIAHCSPYTQYHMHTTAYTPHSHSLLLFQYEFSRITPFSHSRSAFFGVHGHKLIPQIYKIAFCLAIEKFNSDGEFFSFGCKNILCNRVTTAQSTTEL